MSAVRTTAATVLSKVRVSPHLVRVTLATEIGTTGVPDEYVRVLIPPAGAELALPVIDEQWNWTYPEGAVHPSPRVYTISDHRIVDGRTEVDLDVALHERGVGADWARRCVPGDRVGLIDPHGLYAAPADVGWQLLVCDLTGLPALARILRGLAPGQRAEVVVVVTDPADADIVLPSAGDVTIRWVVAGSDPELSEALSAAVVEHPLPPADVDGGRYVWFAGEARASRAVRRHLRRVLGWPQSDFYTCGYWQIDAETWNARYEKVAEQVIADARRVHDELGADQGAYLDALDDIYEQAGL